jgi:4-amino-4-deoxy-L-arabinose transferase-like glycosyltransferase
MRAFEGTDARYLEISRAMFASGDWLVPHLAGIPHLDKPPFTYWAAALGYTAFGVTAWAGRLLEQAALLLTALAVGVAGRRWCGRSGAFAAAFVFLSSALVFVTSRGLSTDLFQLAFFTAAMFAFQRGVAAPGRPAALVLALGLLGASMNVKGPIAAFVALAIWLPFLVATRGRTQLSGRALALGVLAFVALGAPWYVVLALRDPQLLHYWVEVQLAGRIAGEGELRHLHGPLYLLWVWPAGLLPWTPLAALALWRLRPRSGFAKADPIDLYLLLWSTIPVLFFSLPRSQAAPYLLPAFPAAALAIGRAFERGLLADRVARRCVVACGGLAAALALVLAVLLWEPSLIRTSKVETALLAGRAAFAAALALAAVGLIGVSVFAHRTSMVRTTVGVAVGAGLVFALGFDAVAPSLASWRDEGLLVRSVPDAWLVEDGIWRVSALFYFGHLDRFATSVTPFANSREPLLGEGRRLTAEKAETLLRGQTPVFLLSKDRRARELERIPGVTAVHRRNKTVLLANDSARRALSARTALHERSID